MSDQIASGDDATQAVPAVCNVYASFHDYQMEPIDGLGYAILAGDRQITGTTGADGKANPLLGATPGTEVLVYVKRMYTGEFKLIGAVTAPLGDFPLAVVSGQTLHEVQTEVHEGNVGTAAPPPVKPESKAQSGKTQGRALDTGRNSKGHPLAVSNSCPEWLNRNLPSVCNLWSRADFRNVKRLNATMNSPQTNPTVATPTRAEQGAYKNGTWGIDKLLEWMFGVKPAPVQGLSEADSIKLRALIEFAERQVEIKYPFPKISSAVIKDKYAKNKAEDPKKLFPETKENVSIKRCLPYVKIALWRSGYVDGVTATIPAKDSGKDWGHFGFKNISTSLPQVEITHNGDIKYKQPDVSYTAPGDVIVYEEAGNPDASGHVDIRTYHGFVSDFQWVNYPALRKYRVIGVYRKISDTMALARVKAFLRIIREHEAKGYKDPYRALYFDGRQHTTFSDASKHPSSEGKDKPAGAYQIKWGTWDHVTNRTGWPRSFDQEMQDRIAIYLLQERPLDRMPHPRRSALGYIMEGDVENAVTKCNLAKLFAFLPGGGKQQQITMPQLKTLFVQYTKDAS